MALFCLQCFLVSLQDLELPVLCQIQRRPGFKRRWAQTSIVWIGTLPASTVSSLPFFHPPPPLFWSENSPKKSFFGPKTHIWLATLTVTLDTGGVSVKACFAPAVTHHASKHESTDRQRKVAFKQLFADMHMKYCIPAQSCFLHDRIRWFKSITLRVEKLRLECKPWS